MSKRDDPDLASPLSRIIHGVDDTDHLSALCCRAERALAHNSILGAQIVRVTHDADADEFGASEFLGTVGRVPADY